MSIRRIGSLPLSYRNAAGGLPSSYNWSAGDISQSGRHGETVSISEKVNADIVTAMKSREEHRVTTLRMVKSALRSKEIDKREPLTDAEQVAILSTLVKQRRESVESFTKGDRPELAAKEQAEIEMIEGYMPQAAGEDQIRAVVETAIAHLAASGGGKPGLRDMGAAMKIVQQRILADGLRADGKVVADMVKAELAK
jgi:uncharacterized protein YqeY